MMTRAMKMKFVTSFVAFFLNCFLVEEIEQSHVLLCFDNLSIDSKCMFAFDSLWVHSAGNLFVLVFSRIKSREEEMERQNVPFTNKLSSMFKILLDNLMIIKNSSNLKDFC